MKEYKNSIFLYPDHMNGMVVEDSKEKRKSFVLHEEISNCVAECQENGIEVSVLKDGQKLDDICSSNGENIIVASDRSVRNKYLSKNVNVAPNFSVAQNMLKGEDIFAVRMQISQNDLIRLKSLQTYYKEFICNDQYLIIGLVSKSDYNLALRSRVKIIKLNIDWKKEDLILIQLDDLDHVDEIAETYKIILSDGRKLLIALGPDQNVFKIPGHGQHGHNFALFPDNKHLPTRVDDGFLIPPLKEAYFEKVDLKLFNIYKWYSKPSSPTAYKSVLDKYSGVTDLDGNGPITSRHIRHPDNIRVVNQLIKDLNAMGYCAYKHSFLYGGNTYYNVIADLPGNGYWLVKPKVMEIFRNRYWDRIQGNFDLNYKAIENLIDEEFASNLTPNMATTELVNLLDKFIIPSYYPWWLRCKYAGLGAKIIIAGCHLDSTAASSSGYNPVTDAAPGKDDNASGITAMLNTAKYLAQFRGQLRHTVRFCFFNAEEIGLVGSKAYAQYLRANNAPVKAAICADMMGYNSDNNYLFEVHAGYTDPAIRDLSVPFGDIIVNKSQTTVGNGKAQLYKGTSSSGGPDRNVYDGAINRSDHAAFQEQGYPGVLVSEDFFTNLNGEPISDGNPNYHRPTDQTVDEIYASKITCAIAYALKQMAS